jgi:hypothetical protein
MIKENLYRGYTGVETENLPDRFYVLGAPMNYNGGQLMLLKKSYNTTYNNLVYTKTTKYLPSGNVEDESYFYYDNSNQNLTALAHKIGNGVTYPNLDVKILLSG